MQSDELTICGISDVNLGLVKLFHHHVSIFLSLLHIDINEASSLKPLLYLRCHTDSIDNGHAPYFVCDFIRGLELEGFLAVLKAEAQTMEIA